MTSVLDLGGRLGRVRRPPQARTEDGLCAVHMIAYDH
jgi:hypothetical protein